MFYIKLMFYAQRLYEHCPGLPDFDKFLTARVGGYLADLSRRLMFLIRLTIFAQGRVPSDQEIAEIVRRVLRGTACT